MQKKTFFPGFLVSLLVLLTALPASAKDYKYQSVKGDAMQTRIYTLDNGLKVYLSVNKEKPRIQTYIAVKTGSRNDPAETTGLAHYLEHIMFKGTTHFGTTDYAAEKVYLDQIADKYEVYRTLTDKEQRRQCYAQIDSLSQLAAKYNIPNEYDKLVSSIGANGTNAYTSNDVTCYVNDIPANEVEKWLRIESDRFQNMVIRGFHTELEAVYEEYNIGLASDNRKVWDAINRTLFPTHPYGTQTTIGTQEHLKNPSIRNIENYFHKYYVPNNIAVCMAGDFDPDQVIAQIDHYFGSWKQGSDPQAPKYAAQPTLAQPRDTTVVGKEAEQLWMAWKFAGAGSDEADTLQILNAMLSNGKAGLMDLNLDQKMRYLGGGSGVNDMTDYSAFVMLGYPKEGQTLDEVKALLLGEVKNLKEGNFDDDLLTSIINNYKLAEYTKLESNQARANEFVSSFINGEPWEKVVSRLQRISGITRQQIVDFARRHLTDGYVAVYKRRGEDTTQVKIEKPAITAIPSNREYQSQFVNDIISAETAPIAPRFVDYQKDMVQTKTRKSKLPVLYVRNTENDRFTLAYQYDFGEEANKWLPFAASYFDYLGTDKMTAEQLKKQFYKLACSFNIGVGHNTLTLSLYGLGENMEASVALMEDFLANAKVDNDAWQTYVQMEAKSRKDAKLNQKSNYRALFDYARYGSYNPTLNVPTTQEMAAKNTGELTAMIKALNGYEHTVCYYGPAEQEALVKILDKSHKVAKTLAPVPAGKEYTLEQTDKNEVYIAPYEAKNIYLIQYNNSGKQWNPDDMATVSVFNEYFGGGMNTVVFQELRETRGLAYSAAAAYNTPSRKGQPEWSMTYIISQNDKMMDCVRTFHDILTDVPASEKAFALAKQAVEKRLRAARTTKFGVISSYLAAKRLGIDCSTAELVYRGLDKVTMQGVVDFEKQNMAGKPYRYIVLGDEKNLDMESLGKIGPVSHLSTEQIFGY